MSRLIIAGVATLQEIETHYSLDDVVRANIDLTFEQALQAEANKVDGE